MQAGSLKNQVYQGILNDILDGVYKPNTIINEKYLIEQYKVSKTPIREALVQLCSEGILNNIPRFGYQISIISPSEIVEMLEYRKIIEVGALEMCFWKITDEQMEELRKLNHYAMTIEESENPKEHWNVNERFHKTLCSFSGNRYLQKSLDDAMKACTRIANQYFVKVWEDDETGDGNHYELVKALEDKDFQKAKELLIHDIGMMRNKIL